MHTFTQPLSVILSLPLQFCKYYRTRVRVEHDRYSVRLGKTYWPVRLGPTVANQTTKPWASLLEIANLALRLFAHPWSNNSFNMARESQSETFSDSQLGASKQFLLSFHKMHPSTMKTHWDSELLTSALLETRCSVQFLYSINMVVIWQPFQGGTFVLLHPMPGSFRDMGHISHPFFSLARIWPWIATALDLVCTYSLCKSNDPMFRLISSQQL